MFFDFSASPRRGDMRIIIAVLRLLYQTIPRLSILYKTEKRDGVTPSRCTNSRFSFCGYFYA